MGELACAEPSSTHRVPNFARSEPAQASWQTSFALVDRSLAEQQTKLAPRRTTPACCQPTLAFGRAEPTLRKQDSLGVDSRLGNPNGLLIRAHCFVVRRR